MGVSQNGGTPIHLRMFHYKPAILGNPPFMETHVNLITTDYLQYQMLRDPIFRQPTQQKKTSANSGDNVTCSNSWLNFWPKVRLWRPIGNLQCLKLWSKLFPKVKLLRLMGRITSSRLWLNSSPNVKLCRLRASRIWSIVWLKPWVCMDLPIPEPIKNKATSFPKWWIAKWENKRTILSTSRKLWLKLKVCRLLGKSSSCFSEEIPPSSTTPSRQNSSSNCLPFR